MSRFFGKEITAKFKIYSLQEYNYIETYGCNIIPNHCTTKNYMKKSCNTYLNEYKRKSNC